MTHFILIIVFAFNGQLPAQLQILTPDQKTCVALGNALAEELQPIKMECKKVEQI